MFEGLEGLEGLVGLVGLVGLGLRVRVAWGLGFGVSCIRGKREQGAVEEVGVHIGVVCE